MGTTVTNSLNSTASADLAPTIATAAYTCGFAYGMARASDTAESAADAWAARQGTTARFAVAHGCAAAARAAFMRGFGEGLRRPSRPGRVGVRD